MTKPILIIGSQGNMGTRYKACLEYLKHDYLESDLKDGNPWPHPAAYDRAIVATSTDQHYPTCKQLIGLHKDILCEKPITKNKDELEGLRLLSEANYYNGRDWVPSSDFRMVNNLWYALNTVLQRTTNPSTEKRKGTGAIAIMGKMDIYYDVFHTGPDGYPWDQIQLVYMADMEKSVFKNKSPVLDFNINGIDIGRDLIEESYVIMLSQWIHGPGKLWGWKEIMEAHEKCHSHTK